MTDPYRSLAVYCPRCGGRLRHTPPTRCPACDYAMYVNARPTGGLIVLDGDRFLAVKRAAEPRAGLWGTPGGFCDGAEHPADAARREGREELGVDVILGEFVGMYVGSYEFQGEVFPVLDCFFLATLGAGEIRLNPAESAELCWLPLRDAPPLAFPTMDAAIRDACRMVEGVKKGPFPYEKR